MPIEFRCPSCQQQLRVPDESAGKNAKCPKCSTIAIIPSADAAMGTPPPPSLPPVIPPSPFGDAAQPAAGKPFAGGNPFAGEPPHKPSLNPYASPAAGYQPTNLGMPSLPVKNQRVEIGQIWNYALQIWQTNLGLLVGVTLVVIAISYAISIPVAILQSVLEGQGENEALVAVVVIGNIATNLVQLFLGIGQAQIAIKLCRQQQASFGDLFGGGRRFLPVLGMMILALLALIVGFALCIVPGIFLLLMFWPCYYLVVEEKAAVFESFSLGMSITEGNRATTFLLWLLSTAVMTLGVLACCIGLVVAAPLVTVMWATAYLMMSGQIPVAQMTPATPGYYPTGP